MKHLFAAVLMAAACGSTAETVKDYGDNKGSGSAQAMSPSGPNDVQIDVPGVDIKGTVFEPEALERPGMMLSPPKKKTTLDKLRAEIAKTKDVEVRQAYSIGLATMLYEDQKTNKANADKDLQEARQVLRDAVAAAADKVDDLTLKFLGVYEYYLGDYAGAEKAYESLVAKAPKDKDIDTSRAWWGLALLKQNKNADALKVVGGAASDKTPDLAYVQAWAKFRTGDDAGAWQGIVAAQKGWAAKDLPNKGIVDRDVVLFAARAHVPVGDAAATVVANQKDKGKQFDAVAQLGLQWLPGAGRWADAVTACEKALEMGNGVAAPADPAKIKISEAIFQVALDTPDKSVASAKAAIDAVVACGDKCAKEKPDIVQNAYQLARLFHLVYATANDGRYYQPAHDLYGFAAPAAEPDLRNQILKDQTSIEQTGKFAMKNQGKPVGTHDKQAVGAILQRHNAEVQACYEHALAGNPKIAGALTVTLETDETGAIKGVATEPKAGMDDLSAVAGCVAEHAKQWKLSTRGTPGKTRVKLGYTLSKSAKK